MPRICNCFGEGGIEKNCRYKGFLLLHDTCMNQAKQSKQLVTDISGPEWVQVAVYRKRVGQFDKFSGAQMG